MSNKTVFFDSRARKEFNVFPTRAQNKLGAGISALEKHGKLIEPFGKKLDKSFYEIRAKYKGEWRVIYAYLIENKIVLLTAFAKKSQQTPIKELKKAKKRLKKYL